MHIPHITVSRPAVVVAVAAEAVVDEALHTEVAVDAAMVVADVDFKVRDL